MDPTAHFEPMRRDFMKRGGQALLAALLIAQPLPLPAQAAPPAEKEEKEKPQEEVQPAEDLMREHGVLNRILLIYDNMRSRLIQGQDFPVEVLAGAADLIRRFIEDYHEKLEEDYLFPRFQQAGKLVELVKVLKAQHEAGRRITKRIILEATPGLPTDSTRRTKMAATLQQFVRMYRPHEAREDTVLLPSIRSVTTPKEYAELGEYFEKMEDKLFGEGGFFKVVGQVAALEKRLGIYDIAQFTPKA